MKFTNEDLDGAMADLAMLRFFPSEAATRGSIKAYIAKICPHKAALDYVVATLVDRVGEWPGPAQTRRVLAERYRPADGDKSPVVAEDDHIDWNQFPSHEDEGAIPPTDLKRLENPHILLLNGKKASRLAELQAALVARGAKA